MNGVRRPQRGPVLIAGAAVAALVVGVAGGMAAARGGAAAAIPPAPAQHAGCRAHPMTHVHDPGRLTVLADCVTVTGTLKSARLESAYDDLKLSVALDERDQGYLRPANRGVLTVDVVAPDIPDTTLPSAGQRATFTGAWVLNRATKAVELLPTWRVALPPTAPAGTAADTAVGGSKSSAAASLHAGQQLRVSVTTPRRVTVGTRLSVAVTATWTTAAMRQPAAQIRLFMEMTDASGTGIRWKAVQTNTLGRARANLLAIQVPGDYRLNVYVVNADKAITSSNPVTVGRG